jgi:hypothetical protein
VTFAAVGSAITATATTFSLTPAAVGDFILVEVVSETEADYATALSSSNVTWSVLVAHTVLSANAVVATVFLGHVTSASAATVTVTVAAGSPALRISGQEFSTTAGFAAVTLDTSGTVNAATTLSPSLTPSHGSGELYFYYGFNATTATAGSTSGYTYDIDANGNGMCFDAACTSAAQQPAWGASDTISGIAVLLYEAPVTPAPFAQPGKALKGRQSARKGATAGSPGAPYVYVPVVPAPFAQPRKAAAGRPSARKGAAHALHPGAPYVYVPPTPSPFIQPLRAIRGRRSARKGTAPGSPVTASTWPLVQETSGETAGTTLTLTLPKTLTIGNTLLIALAGYYEGSISAITVGGVAATFTQYAYASSNSAQIWGAPVATASATVAVTTSVGGIIGWAYEVAGSVTLDESAAATGASASWSSGATGTVIPYWTHFTVGLGTTVSTGSITGPASGWVNEAAYTGVATGGQHAGGVSGWRQGTGATTYTYSGTSGSSSAWGAVTASFLVVPPQGEVQGGWGGYVFSEHAAVGYTGITATFTIPPLTGGDYNSIWIGMGNVYQTGVYQTYSTSYSGNSASRPWSWWLPGSGEQWNAAAYPTAAGDTLKLTMQLTSTDWLMTIDNQTEGWSYTEVRSVLAVNIGSIDDDGIGPAVWPYPVKSAEVIIEKETTELANYGSIAFTSITTTPAATLAPYPIFTASTAIDQYPGAYNLASGSFSMYWNNYS